MLDIKKINEVCVRAIWGDIAKLPANRTIPSPYIAPFWVFTKSYRLWWFINTFLMVDFGGTIMLCIVSSYF
jgi:hypothetical protein